MPYSRISSAQIRLLQGEVISVETDISRGLHSFSIVGLPDKAIEESRDRVSAAIKNSGFKSPKQTNAKIVVSLAPAQTKKEGPSFDLAIALGYLLAAGEISCDVESRIFAGELSLDGCLRPISGALSFARAAKKAGFEEIFVPAANAAEASLIDGIAVFGVSSLRETIDHLEARSVKKPFDSSTRNSGATRVASETRFSIDDIVGHEAAKRAILIAAAGGHSIALFGPPGTGKTMLARALHGLLPPLSFDEMVEATEIHSIAGMADRSIITNPPIRSPHHSTSAQAIIGGGPALRPGEATLAHRGVLFMDEFPEFSRDVIEALRQPMEEGLISLARARGYGTFPARFILVAAMNLCPCGNRGSSERKCSCSAKEMARYSKKISGPIADRIDMWVEVSNIDRERLSRLRSDGMQEEAMRAKVREARAAQARRAADMGKAPCTNATIPTADLRDAINISPDGISILEQASRQYNLSGRGVHRVIRLARTIADIDRSHETKAPHILEALQYRQRKE